MTHPLTAHDLFRANEALARLHELARDNALFTDRVDVDAERVKSALTEAERLQASEEERLQASEEERLQASEEARR